MTYGLENYHLETVGDEILQMEPAMVEDGQEGTVALTADIRTEQLLMKEGESFRMEVDRPESLGAPVEEGEIVGSVAYYLNGEIMDLFPVRTAGTVGKVDFWWCLEQVLDRWI